MPASEEFRQYAAECLSLAQKTESPEQRARLLQMAQAWRELADKLELKTGTR
jgi:hypothetical protein